MDFPGKCFIDSVRIGWKNTEHDKADGAESYQSETVTQPYRGMGYDEEFDDDNEYRCSEQERRPRSECLQGPEDELLMVFCHRSYPGLTSFSTVETKIKKRGTPAASSSNT
jgi:hypothetical protein